MAELHADLPNKSFTKPNGIVSATVCSKSGKLPIPGLCDAHLRTEYFAQGTVPEETCDVHYSGLICEYSGLCACENCPFKVEGTVEFMPIEDPSLQRGSSSIDENGNPVMANTTNMCPHNVEFFLQPNYMDIINQQAAELEQRRQAAMWAAMNQGQ